MDPLSDVLSLLKPRSYVSGGFDVGGRLSVRFGGHEGIKCYAVVSGEMWLAVEGVSDACATEDGRLLSAAARLAFPSRDRFDRAALRGPFNSGHGAQDWRRRNRQRRWGLPCRRRALRARRGSRGHAAGNVAADRAYPEGIGQGGDALVFGAHETGIARGPAGRLSDGAAPRPFDAASGAEVASRGRVGGRRRLAIRSGRQADKRCDRRHPRRRRRTVGHCRRWRSAQGCLARPSRFEFKETVGASPMEYLIRWRMLLAGDRLIEFARSRFRHRALAGL